MDDDTPSASGHDFDFVESLRVLVGESKQEFMVHRDIITHRSAFFAAAVSARWKPVPIKHIELPEDKPHIFADYLHCLYLGTVKFKGKATQDLADLYILADKLGDLKGANTIMDRFILCNEAVRTLPLVRDVIYIFEHTAPSSKLRQVVVDYWMHAAAPAELKDIIQDVTRRGETDISAALLLEVVRVMEESFETKVRKAFNQQVPYRRKCYYHQHGEGCLECPSVSDK
ncbi:hypothetical protein LTR27_001306 [Elasticomyces elasticus]|nr:hypothetical protein LTR27_001306 [Elasticomyces elasticus]